MTDALRVGDGHTELSEEDRLGLIPSYISTLGELYEAEQRNIADAMLDRHPDTAQLLDDKYMRSLHRDMFRDVWTWAGRYRTRATNIGIDPAGIPVAVRELVSDAMAWTEHNTFPPDELGVRFHHRLVAIHPFPNGNGRHGRVAANLLVQALGQASYAWGAGLDVETAELRERYLSALRRADAGDLTELQCFARS